MSDKREEKVYDYMKKEGVPLTRSVIAYFTRIDRVAVGNILFKLLLENKIVVSENLMKEDPITNMCGEFFYWKIASEKPDEHEKY